MTERNRLSRRAFLRNVGGMTGAILLAGCGNTPAPGTGAAAGTTAEAGGTAAAAAGPPPTPVPTPVPERAASADRKTVIEVWYPYASPNWEAYWKGFEDSQPDIGIKAVFAANDTTGNAKFFTAVASGRPPDVAWVDGPQVAEWAARGVLEPLDDLVAAAGIKPDDFWTPSWNQCVYNGKVYALTLSSDANFGFYWNKG
ncbi:MAG: extracellular solute-binding protein, partial [Chloroflexota bacterium]|nr:extracellular solute-binding protein [Chloroflexota bacterium]